MNRLVTATAADLDTPKGILARRLIRAVAPDARVELVTAPLPSLDALDALKGVDVVFGCMDNDGARLVLNELAVAYGIPYMDLAVGIDAEEGAVAAAGGRVAVVLPGGPCLNCMGEIDPVEARYFLSSPEERAEQARRGYVRGMDVPAPSVVSLNGIVASVAALEFAVLISGLREVSPLTDFDLLGTGRTTKNSWLTPRRVGRLDGCVHCALAGLGEAAGVEGRYRRVHAEAAKVQPV